MKRIIEETEDLTTINLPSGPPFKTERWMDKSTGKWYMDKFYKLGKVYLVRTVDKPGYTV